MFLSFLINLLTFAFLSRLFFVLEFLRQNTAFSSKFVIPAVSPDWLLVEKESSLNASDDLREKILLIKSDLEANMDVGGRNTRNIVILSHQLDAIAEELRRREVTLEETSISFDVMKTLLY